MYRNLLDLYTDYLLSRFGQTSATGLSHLGEGVVGHDKNYPFFIQLKFYLKGYLVVRQAPGQGTSNRRWLPNF